MGIFWNNSTSNDFLDHSGLCENELFAMHAPLLMFYAIWMLPKQPLPGLLVQTKYNTQIFNKQENQAPVSCLEQAPTH